MIAGSRCRPTRGRPKNRKLELDAAEIRFRAERRLGEMMAEQRETIGLAQGKRTDLGPNSTQVGTPTLAEAGIDKHLADRARKMAAVPAAEFEEKVAAFRARGSEEGARVTSDLLARGGQHLYGGSGDNEWYTPAEYLDAAREVLGSIDLDPASCEVAQRTVRATAFFTAEADGLSREWHGRVWLNPPYSQPLIADFVSKLLAERRSRRVTDAIMLTHNCTDTAWFHEAAGGADATCFTRGRIGFYKNDEGASGSALRGQTFFYFGDDVERFATVFAAVGFISLPYRGEAYLRNNVTLRAA